MEKLVMFITAQSGVLQPMTLFDIMVLYWTFYTITLVTKFKGLELLKGVKTNSQFHSL